jgi:hypothetical protein
MTDPTVETAAANLLPSHPNKRRGGNSPGRRKIRGQKQYYRRIMQKTQEFVPDLAPDHWYDYWHYHADWPGYGNLSWKHRKAHLAAYYQVFKTFVRLTANYSLPFQLWLWLSVEDSGQDAVYFHTPNPNGDGNHFPLKLPEVQWGLPALEEYLGDVLAMPVRVGVQKYPDGSYSFYIYSPEHGEPLE